MKPVSKHNKHLLMEILERKVKKLLAKIKAEDHFGDAEYEFSNKHPNLEFTLSVSHHEFENAVLTEENEILKKRLERAQKKLKHLGSSEHED